MADGTKTVVTRLRNVGYFSANFYKYWHMKPYSSFPWNLTENLVTLEGRVPGQQIGRAPTILGEATRKAIQAATASDQPFFLVVNSADPHRPFHGSPWERTLKNNIVEEPSRIYDPSEVTVPHPLPDIPGVREDIARYASSVRRLDDMVGRCLEELEASGLANNTIVMFVSDNGMYV